MKPKDSAENLLAMVKMHDDVIDRINQAFSDENYIECCWLCYACFESRVNRTMEKLCPGCPKPARTDGRHIGITTKLDCLNRLRQSSYALFADASLNEITNIKGWCKDRNALIHDLVSLDNYERSNREFKSLAKRGVGLVTRIYSSVSTIRNNYYETEVIPEFNNAVAKKCRLKSKCITEGAKDEATNLRDVR